MTYVSSLYKHFLWLALAFFCCANQSTLHASGPGPKEHDLRLIGQGGGCAGLIPHNHAGLPLELQNLQSSFCAASQALPEGDQAGFQAFDYALYPTSPFYQEVTGQEALFQAMVSRVEESGAGYYLLIAKQHSRQAYNTQFKVRLKLPLTACVTAETVASLERILADSMSVAYQAQGNNPDLLSSVEMAALRKMGNTLRKLYAGNCCELASNVNIAGELRGLGGKDVGGSALTVKTMTGWSPPTTVPSGQILDYAGLSVVADGDQGHYAIENLATALQAKINEVITKEPTSLKVIITKDDPDNCMEQLEALKNVFQNAEFAMWLHFSIPDPASGSANLVLLGKVPPSGFEGTGPVPEEDVAGLKPPRDSTQGKPLIPVLAWLAKGFTSALVEATIQFFLNYDGDAWAAAQKIDWKEVGWEGLVGCLPWGKNKWVAMAGEAFAAGTGKVLIQWSNGKYNALSDDQVWYEVASDFGFAFLQHLTVELAFNTFGMPIIMYLTKWKGRCFLDGTPVWGIQDRKKIEALRLGEYVLSQKVSEPSMGEGGSFWDTHISVEQHMVDYTPLDTTGGNPWYALELLMTHPKTNDTVKINLLRPKWWLDKTIFANDRYLYIDLPEFGVKGAAFVNHIAAFSPELPVEAQGPYQEASMVTGLFSRKSDHIHQITFDNGDTLFVTKEHPFYVDGSWVPAHELHKGTAVMTEKNIPAQVLHNQTLCGTFAVRNLEVRGSHNYLVGNSGEVAHNGYVEDRTAKLIEFIEFIKNSNSFWRKAILDRLIDNMWKVMRQPNAPGVKQPLQNVMRNLVEKIAFLYRYSAHDFVDANNYYNTNFPIIDMYKLADNFGISVKTLTTYPSSNLKEHIDACAKALRDEKITYKKITIMKK